ncbi:hypothetical protein AOLI_G00070720 [Acnodon oligacanthus]
MVKGLILAGLLVLLCHEVAVQAHVLTRHNSANSISKLKSLLQQFEEALAAEEGTEGAVDYEDRSQSQAAPGWERNREEQPPPGEDPSPEENLEAQKKNLMDLLLSTRSKGFSGCFGGRLDRIGSSSSLGCNSMRAPQITHTAHQPPREKRTVCYHLVQLEGSHVEELSGSDPHLLKLARDMPIAGMDGDRLNKLDPTTKCVCLALHLPCPVRFLYINYSLLLKPPKTSTGITTAL